MFVCVRVRVRVRVLVCVSVCLCDVGAEQVANYASRIAIGSLILQYASRDTTDTDTDTDAYVNTCQYDIILVLTGLCRIDSY